MGIIMKGKASFPMFLVNEKKNTKTGLKVVVCILFFPNYTECRETKDEN